MPKDVAESDSDSDSDWNEELRNAVRKKEGKSGTITEKDRIKRMEECLDEGAEIDAVDKQNNTVLHMAVRKEYVKIVRFLVEQKAKINIPNRKEQTALTLAEATSNADILNALKGLPNDPDSQLPAQQTASTSQTTSSDKTASASADNHTAVENERKSLKREAATVCNEDNENSKRRRLHTAEEEEEEISSGDDSESEDDVVDNEIEIGGQRSQFAGDNTYSASGLKHTEHGNVYQLKLLMLFLNRGLREGYSFRLATEMDAAEKFDDLVFQYENRTGSGTVYRFLQAKHKQNETKTIGARDLLTENDDEFSLQKYFISYRRIEKHSELSRSAFEDFVLCTNIDFDFEGLKSANICLEKVDKPDAFLDFKNVAKQPARYKFRVDNESELHKILKRTADVYRLAKVLVEHVCESKNITLKNELFKLYHTALAEEVIDVKDKRFSINFIKGENLSEKAKNFREIFCAEASIQLKKSLGIYTSEKTAWEEMTKNPLKISPSFGQQFELSTDPTLNPLTEFSEELVKLINSADNDNVVTVDGKKYRKNAKAASREKIFVDNIDKLAGHVLILETEKIKFRSQFFDDSIKPPGNIGGLKDLLKARLGSKYNDLRRYQFKMTNFKTCEEEQLESKTELPGDDIDDKEIDEFFDKLIFAVNQPNEIELGNIITREIAADSQFNLLNADLVGDSFQKEMLDWFKEKGKEKGKEGRFYSAKDGRDFFDSIERKVNTLVSLGLSLSYPEELEGYGIEFAEENKKLKDFLTRDSDPGVKPVLNLIAARETLLTSIRVHRAIQQTGRYKEKDSLMFLRLHTLLLPGIKRRVIRAFESPDSHHLLVINCGSAEKQDFQELYSQLCRTMRKNVANKLILVTQRPESSANRSSFHLKNCDRAEDDVRFEDLTPESQYQLIRKQVINFQGREERTSFERLLRISGLVDTGTEQLTNFKSMIDATTLVQLICNEEIGVGSALEGLGNIEKYYMERKINQPAQSSGSNDIAEPSSLSLNQLIDDDEKQKYVIISDSAGAGKTTILTYLATEMKRKRPDLWVFKVNLNDFTEALDKERENRTFQSTDTDQAFEFFVENLSTVKTDLEKMLLTTMIKSRLRVALLFDGFDEISPHYSNVVFDLLQAFKTFGVAKLIVATRPIVRKQLEDGLKLNSHTIEPISDSDHETILIRYWKANLGVDEQFENRLKTFAEALMKVFADSMRLSVSGLVITPLHTWMLAVIYQDGKKSELGKSGHETCAEFLASKNPTPKLPAKLKIVRLYEVFVSEMFDRYITEKKKGELTIPGVEEDAQELRKIFLRKHQILAWHYLFPRVDYLPKIASKPTPTDQDEPQRIMDKEETFFDGFKVAYSVDEIFFEQSEIESLDEWLAEISLGKIERTGIITHVMDNRAHFVHRTFAEYFAARFLISTLLRRADSLPHLQNFICSNILLDMNSAMIRTFWNDLLPECPGPLQGRNEAWRADLQGFGSRILYSLSFSDGNYELNKFLLNQFWKQNDTLKDVMRAEVYNDRTILHTALSLGFNSEMPKKWLPVGSPEQNRKSIIDAEPQGNLDFVQFLVNEGAEVNAEDSDQNTPLHDAAYFGRFSALRWLVEEKGGDINRRNNDGATVLHRAAAGGHWGIVEWLVGEKNVDLNDGMNNGFTVLHQAADLKQWELVKWLIRENSVDVNLKTTSGSTVLRFAVVRNKIEAVGWLAENGANVDELLFQYGFLEFHKTGCKIRFLDLVSAGVCVRRYPNLKQGDKNLSYMCTSKKPEDCCHHGAAYRCILELMKFDKVSTQFKCCSGN